MESIFQSFFSERAIAQSLLENLKRHLSFCDLFSTKKFPSQYQIKKDQMKKIKIEED